MVNLELVCLGVLYLCLLLAVLDGAEMSMQQWVLYSYMPG